VGSAGRPERAIAEAREDVRRRDAERFAPHRAGEIQSSRDLLPKNFEDIAARNCRPAAGGGTR